LPAVATSPAGTAVPPALVLPPPHAEMKNAAMNRDEGRILRRTIAHGEAWDQSPSTRARRKDGSQAAHQGCNPHHSSNSASAIADAFGPGEYPLIIKPVFDDANKTRRRIPYEALHGISHRSTTKDSSYPQGVEGFCLHATRGDWAIFGAILFGLTSGIIGGIVGANIGHEETVLFSDTPPPRTR